MSSKGSAAMINIALPKGRLGVSAAELFSQAGYTFDCVCDNTRRLFFVNHKMNVSMFWVKPFDVPAFVESGAADLGVCGNDVLLEKDLDIYEIFDLRKGICRLSVAGKNTSAFNNNRKLRVATKYPNVSRKYYARLGRDVDIIELNGSMEIAPVIGIADVIIDIIQSGATMRENGLTEFECVCDVSARLVANIAAFQTKHYEISEILRKISKALKED